MSVLPIDVQRAASRYAFGTADGPIDQIPVADRAGTVDAVAAKMGISREEVVTALEIHWLESSGLAGSRGLQGQARIPEGPVVYGGIDALSIQIVGLDDGPTHNARSVHAQFAGAAPTEVRWERPLDFETDLSRRNRKLDEALPRGKVGEYGLLALKDLDDDDPLLDTKIYRGIGGRDPAQIALRMTGHLVPEGTSGDYEHFKTYDHRDPLDAYEWSLDPFVAAKGAGGLGTLMSISLRDLRDQGAEFCRKRGDTEGGIFISSVVAPEYRVVDNRGDVYKLSGRTDTTRRPAQREGAKKLRAALERHEGWPGLHKAQPKLAERMLGHKIGETERLVRHWLQRLEDVAPEDPVRARTSSALEALVADSDLDPQSKLQKMEALLRRAALRTADRLDQLPDPIR